MPKCKQCGGYGPEADFGVCVSCEIENDTDKEAIARLIEEGHPLHCSERIIWGDGECECGIYSAKYDPYWWTKSVNHE